MISGKKIVVVLPAYNAGKTLFRTVSEIPKDIVDEIVLVDDFSNDHTVDVANKIGIRNIIKHEKNLGYGANQKTCYNVALQMQADIIIMLHPDYQYTPLLIPSMAYLVANGVYSVVLGSRILGKGALRGGMPGYKYFFNRVLTLVQNILMGQKLSEYHTGYRAFTAEALRDVPFNQNSSGFIFDNEILCQLLYRNHSIGEISCPTRYFSDSSSIGFLQSVVYGLGVIKNSLAYRASKMGLVRSRLFH